MSRQGTEGYNEEDHDATGYAVFTFVKDADTRLRELKLGWTGDGITKSRAQLAGQGGFLPDEERRSG